MDVVDIVDIILAVLIILSFIHGIRLGAAVQVLSFGGLLAGLVAGSFLAPSAASIVSGSTAKSIVALVVVFLMAAVLGAIGRLVGLKIVPYVRMIGLRPLDSLLGAAVAVLATLTVAWLLSGLLVTQRFPALSRDIQRSVILHEMDSVLPPTPSWISRLQSLVDSKGFPSVFANLIPEVAPPVKVAGGPQVAKAVAADEASTVKVVGAGCGQIQEGSGFVVAPGLVLTNAHVVAGIAHPYVVDAAGQHRSVAVYFDPRFDLSLLRVPGLVDPPLHILGSKVPRGTIAAVLGYPEGGPFNARPAGVMAEFMAQGRDIYGQGLTDRHVYEVQAVVQPGNSGGPLVEPNGSVIGVVFSRSVTNPNIGFALASPGVLSRVTKAEKSTTPSGTGSCIP